MPSRSVVSNTSDASSPELQAHSSRYIVKELYRHVRTTASAVSSVLYPLTSEVFNFFSFLSLAKTIQVRSKSAYLDVFVS